MELSGHERPPLSSIRRWVADVLAGESEDCVDDAVLLTNELATNVYDHAMPPRRIRLTKAAARSVVRIEVDDGATDRLPVMGTSRLGRYRGRGLVMVEYLARRRGVTRRARGARRCGRRSSATAGRPCGPRTRSGPAKPTPYRRARR